MAEVEVWFRDKEFTTDWMSKKVPRWHRFLQSLREKPVDVLEVGSFEGRSAVFLLNYLPLAQVTCIDFFKGVLEARFDANVAPFGSRLTKLKGSAISHIDALVQDGAKFDLIYLDAGKHRDHVLALSLLSWPLLKRRGILIWDDYDWGLDRPAAERPHDGIDIFLKIHEGEYKMMWQQGQVFVQKTGLPTPPPGASPLNPNLSY
ncbi:class I SAM-dependent methyltransferase [Corticibacterium sp. UT-5YL-CI-8]|nr:class I SAM-dependent methyltransferase [Tianweitania sp. UT-5YL-CI-8]